MCRWGILLLYNNVRTKLGAQLRILVTRRRPSPPVKLYSFDDQMPVVIQFVEVHETSSPFCLSSTFSHVHTYLCHGAPSVQTFAVVTRDRICHVHSASLQSPVRDVQVKPTDLPTCTEFDLTDSLRVQRYPWAPVRACRVVQPSKLWF